MKTSVQVVVIGGGIVGCSVLYHLCKVGWNDVLLLEKRDLTAGSTWHAAGNVTFFGHYPEITQLYVDSLATYLEAEHKCGDPIGFHQTGSLRLATTTEELRFYQNLTGLYEAMNVNYEVVDVETIEKLHPLLNTQGLFGAAHTPDDGHVDPSATTRALAKVATQAGAQIQRHCEVKKLVIDANGKWRIQTTDGVVLAEHVVVATSFWARELLEPLGLNLPLYALEHHELITDSLVEVENLCCKLPTVRDPYPPVNIRQEGSGFLFGIYESNPKPWMIDGIPASFGEELLENDIERLEPHLERLFERIPMMAEVPIKAVHNGPICYTPDGCPLLGPVVSMPGLWLAAGFSIGIGTGGGSGKYLSHWIAKGNPPYEIPAVSPLRFSQKMSRNQAVDLIVRSYAKGYALRLN